MTILNNKVHLGFWLGCTFCFGYQNSGGYRFRRVMGFSGFITLFTLVCWALALALRVALMSCEEAPMRNWYSPSATTQAEAASSKEARSAAFTVRVSVSLSPAFSALV